MAVTQVEYSKARREAEAILGINPDKEWKVFDKDLSAVIASKMPSHILQAVVEDTIILPPSSFWVPDWVQICQDELFERLILKSDKCL